MNKSEEAVKYIIDVWDEVTGRTWRERPDHVQEKFLEAEKELHNKSCAVDCREPFYCDSEINGLPKCESQCLGCEGLERDGEVNSIKIR